jgi:hypothetical protein
MTKIMEKWKAVFFVKSKWKLLFRKGIQNYDSTTATRDIKIK